MVVEKETHCPFCGRRNDLHEGAPGAEPKPGDIGICWNCHGLAVFTEDGDMRKPTPEERREFNADPEIRAARAAMRESYLPQQAAHLVWPERGRGTR